jgi:hypothetical protein
MNKFQEIAIAWYNTLFKPEEGRELADYRFSVCLGCEHMKQSEVGNFYYCGACGCALAAKVRSPKGKDACPKQKWEK